VRSVLARPRRRRRPACTAVHLRGSY
jgi:hypothetical protein